MTGPPCKIKLIIPPNKDLFSELLEPQGSQEGALEPGGKVLQLDAKGIKLDPNARTEEGLFYLTIDGLERVLWYKTQFVAEGVTRIATRYDEPRVRFEAITRRQERPTRQACGCIHSRQRSRQRRFRLPPDSGQGGTGDR